MSAIDVAAPGSLGACLITAPRVKSELRMLETAMPLAVRSISESRGGTMGIRCTGAGVLALGMLAVLPRPFVAQQPLVATSVAAGDIHTCALTSDGRAYCWGNNEAGALGGAPVPGCSPADKNCTRPVAVGTDVRFTSVSSGYEHTCALDADSTAWCWGTNLLGELGVEPSSDERCARGVPCKRRPMRVPTDLKFVRIVAGMFQTCALDAVGRAYCWGYHNLRSRLGDPGRKVCVAGDPPESLPCVAEPVLVDSTAAFTTIDVQRGNTCGLRKDGELLCWGADYGTSMQMLGASKGHTEYVDISVGGRLRGCALVNTGAVYCWGRWPIGGDFETMDFFVADSGFTLVSSGMLHSCGLHRSGRAYCWGANAAGELGAGGGALVMGPRGPTASLDRPAGDQVFRALSCRGSHSCGVTSSGTIMCWGSNKGGELGDGSTKNRNRPTAVAAPLGVAP